MFTPARSSSDSKFSSCSCLFLLAFALSPLSAPFCLLNLLGKERFFLCFWWVILVDSD